MIHKFFLDEVSENPGYDYSRYHHKVPIISMHTDLLEYISDSLLWLSSYNPARSMEKQVGFNLCGPTVIKSDGAKKLYEISKAWSQLFKQSPDDLHLTGGYTWIHEEAVETGEYEKFIFDRDEVVGCFEILAGTCLGVSESEDASFIMHYGI